jgi:hypothetical protein
MTTGALGREVELEVAVVGVAVVPADERRGRPAPGQVLPGMPSDLSVCAPVAYTTAS